MCFFIGGLFTFILWSADIREKKAMSVRYCFEERADGSLYHYVCGK